MECKEVNKSTLDTAKAGINRNIVECKVAEEYAELVGRLVLIETLWNVKKVDFSPGKSIDFVLIETLWNVKLHTPHDCRHTFSY